jgi:hypothetical protein
LEIAFRKAEPSLSSKIIRWWIKSPYSHCELVFSNGLTFSAYIEEYRTCFKNKEHLDSEWDYITLPMSIENEYKIYQFCLKETDCKYDIIGLVFTQIIPLSFENPYWWFCSEVCTAALQANNMLLGIVPHETDPGELYKLVKENYHERIN